MVTLPCALLQIVASGLDVLSFWSLCATCSSVNTCLEPLKPVRQLTCLLLCDNLAPHQARAVKAWAKQHPLGGYFTSRGVRWELNLFRYAWSCGVPRPRGSWRVEAVPTMWIPFLSIRDRQVYIPEAVEVQHLLHTFELDKEQHLTTEQRAMRYDKIMTTYRDFCSVAQESLKQTDLQYADAFQTTIMERLRTRL